MLSYCNILINGLSFIYINIEDFEIGISNNDCWRKLENLNIKI